MQENGFEFAHLTSGWNKIIKNMSWLLPTPETNKNKTEKTDSETEKLLNNLEAADNQSRAIFTVDRLTRRLGRSEFVWYCAFVWSGKNGGGSNKKSGQNGCRYRIGKAVDWSWRALFSICVWSVNSRINANLTTTYNTNCVSRKNCFITRTMSNPAIFPELKNELRKDGYLPQKDDDIEKLATFKIKSEFADNKDLERVVNLGE